MVVVKKINLVLFKGEYNTVNSINSLIFDPSAQLCEHNSYLFGILLFLTRTKYAGDNNEGLCYEEIEYSITGSYIV